MPFKLFHGDSVDDTAIWCPVCFDLDYQNLKTYGEKEGGANPRRLVKGTLPGFRIWWRGRPDFQQRAEQYACVFCAVLLQIVDRFWKRTVPTRQHTLPVFDLKVFKNGSVEILSMRELPRRPLGLLLFTPSGHSPVWGRLPPAPEISPSANSKRALQYLRTKLETCSLEHRECNLDCPVLPTRVLDVGSSRTKQCVKLLEAPPGTPGKYIALSYCWGDGNGLQATKSNLSDLLQGVDEDELPATIQDAVELARYLGVKYLWVDALCILQDDAQDWIHESAHMAAVYAQAFVTISASSVASSRISFLHHSRGNKEVLFHWQSPKSATNVRDTDNSTEEMPVRGDMLAVRRTTLSGFHQARYDDIIDPTMTRAWTLQEHTLSTRLVCFSTDEIQWTCRTLRACECDNPEQHESPRLEQLQRDLRMAVANEHTEPGRDIETSKQGWLSTFFRFWTELVQAYCRRDLTCMRDKLPGLSGVAHEFCQTFNQARLTEVIDVPPVRYLAGLWDFEIHMMLLWSTHQPSRFVEYRAPSWSWASVEAGIIGTIAEHRSLQPQADVLAAVCTLANPEDPFGQVVRKGTYLRLRGTVLETRVWLKRRAANWAVSYMTEYGPIRIDADVVDVPLDEVVWEGNSAAAAESSAGVDDNAEPTDHVQTRTLQRLSQGPERSSYAAEAKSLKHILSSSEAETGSDDETEDVIYERNKWEESNLGREFTVWLLHVADDAPGAHVLVLGRPAGDEQVYERLGVFTIYPEDKWAEDISGLPKSIITIV